VEADLARCRSHRVPVFATEWLFEMDPVCRRSKVEPECPRDAIPPFITPEEEEEQEERVLLVSSADLTGWRSRPLPVVLYLGLLGLVSEARRERLIWLQQPPQPV